MNYRDIPAILEAAKKMAPLQEPFQLF